MRHNKSSNFRTKSNIYDGAFFTSVKSYFKNVLNSIELPRGSIFWTTHPFVRKLTTGNFGREKVLLTIEQFEITQWNGIINEEGSHREVFYQKGIHITGKHLCQSLFNKVSGLISFLIKRDSGTGVFLWILRNFYKHLSYRVHPAAASKCFLFPLFQLLWSKHFCQNKQRCFV